MNEWGKYSTCLRCKAVIGDACVNMHPTFAGRRRPEIAQVHPGRPRATREELEAQAANISASAREFLGEIYHQIDTRPSVLDVPSATIGKTKGRKNRKWTRPKSRTASPASR